MLVFIIPDEFQTNTELLQEIVSRANIDIKKLDTSQPQKIIARTLTKHDIKHVDLLLEFLKDPEPERFYQPQDTHFNSFGNNKTANVLGEEIKKIIKNTNQNL